MSPAKLPATEAGRMAALRSYDILDSLPEAEYDGITRLAAAICDTPVSLITLVDENRQWFKSAVGVSATETPRAYAFCGHAILRPEETMVVEDARLDSRFADNPLVTEDPNIVFYVGVPLVDPDGHALGTLCVIDNKVRHLSPVQQEALEILRQQVITLLVLRRTNKALRESEEKARTEAEAQMRTASALRLSESRYRSLIEEAPVATALYTGRDLIVSLCNPIMLSYWGKDAGVKGKKLAEALPELEGQPFLDILRNIFDTGETYLAEGAPVDLESNGILKTSYFNFTYKPLFDDKGQVYAILNMAIDVTDHVLAEREVRESQRRLLAWFEDSPVAIATIDAQDDLPFVTANTCYSRLVGREPQDLIGKPLVDALPELEGKGFDQLLKQVIRTGEPVHFEEIAIHLQRNTGPASIFVNFTYQPTFSLSGEISGVLVVANDVTRQVLDRQAVELSEAHYRDAIELAQLGTWSLDPQTGTVEYSERLQHWLGAVSNRESFAEALGRIHPSDLDRVKEASAAALVYAGGGLFNEEYRIIQKDTGTELILHSTGKTTFDPSGTPVIMQGAMHNVTTHRRLQAALEGEVQLRTEALQYANAELNGINSELAESNKRLLQSNNELEQYAYVASHDLQEPLRKIRIFSTMLQSAPDIPSKSQAIISKIGQSAERMSLLIKDLLDFSRLLQSDVVMQLVPLQQVMQAVIGDFELTIVEKNAVVHLSQLPVIQAVGLQMNQLFYNLVGNALKFSVNGVSPVISVGARKLETTEIRQYIHRPLQGAGYYHFTVADNGIGFETQYSERIFEVFKRLHAKDEYPGSGIGLSLCRRIVATHNGVLYAESSPGAGSTFHIILPDRQTGDQVVSE